MNKTKWVIGTSVAIMMWRKHRKMFVKIFPLWNHMIKKYIVMN